MLLPLLVLLPLVGALLAAWCARYGRDASALAAAGITGSALLMLLSLAPRVLGGEVVRAGWDWVPALGIRAAFMADGLGFLFASLILGIGLLVVVYARYYLPPTDTLGRFYGYLLLFMSAMLGVVLAEDLVLLIVSWELTSISSFLLIGYSSHLAAGRQGARMALAVTGAGGLCLLGGGLLLGHIAGSFQLGDILAAGPAIQASPLYLPALVLILLGAFTKSAQFPFHFWLPHAMAAPTPVSAYLHSATMVKAGVFLLARLHPALAGTAAWFYLVGGTGLATLLVGAWFAMFHRDLKGLLAYSTISHLGLITFLFGVGTPGAAVVGVFHIMNHAAFKAALFMNAGVVYAASGTQEIRALGGLRTALPLTAGLAVVAAAAMAGIPPLNGFLSKEMFLEETLHLPHMHAAPWLVPLVATIGSALSVAYALRYTLDVFVVPPAEAPRAVRALPLGMQAPMALLVGICVLVGLFPNTVAGPLLKVAAEATIGGATPKIKLALWHGLNLPLAMSGVAVIAGAGIWAGRARLQALAVPLDGKALFERAIAAAVRASRAVTTGMQSGSLQRYLAVLVAVFIVAGGAPLLLDPVAAGTLPRQPVDAVSVAAWLMLVVGTLATVVAHRSRIVAVIALGIVGLVMALAFVHLSAPDLALTQISVEVVTIVLILLALHELPQRTPAESSLPRRVRDITLAGFAGLWAGGVSWLMMTRPLESISAYHLAESKPGGGGTNVVNVILVDFRGYDTFGEITVLAIAALGIYALIDGMGVQRRFEVGPLHDEARHPLLLATVARLLLPLALLVGAYLFLRGHNHPGGGFVAGLVVAVALLLQYIASGIGWTQRRIGKDFHPLVAGGVLLAALGGLASLGFGRPFLTQWFDYFHLPVIGKFELASAVVFDLGVFLAVVGAVLLVLVNMGKLSEARARAQARARKGA